MIDKEDAARLRMRQDRADWLAYKANPKDASLLLPWMLIKPREPVKRASKANGKKHDETDVFG